MSDAVEAHLTHHVLSGRRGTVEQQAARGKAARKALSRSSHATLELSPDRRDPVDILEEQAGSRVPELVPIRYGRMASSPFAFYRGAAAVMAADLAGTASSGINAQLCGDAHLMNFGVYNSPDRRLVFDLNDFDETLPGPWEWDLKRLVASLVIAGQENGYTQVEIEEVVRDSVRTYRTAMASFAAQGNLAVWYSRLEVEALLDTVRGQLAPERVKAFNRQTAKFAARDSLQAFGKLTTQTDDGPRFRSEPPLIVPVDELLGTDWEWVVETADRFLSHYLRSLPDDRRDLVLQYRFVDLARKVSLASGDPMFDAARASFGRKLGEAMGALGDHLAAEGILREILDMPELDRVTRGRIQLAIALAVAMTMRRACWSRALSSSPARIRRLKPRFSLRSANFARWRASGRKRRTRFVGLSTFSRHGMATRRYSRALSHDSQRRRSSSATLPRVMPRW